MRSDVSMTRWNHNYYPLLTQPRRIKKKKKQKNFTDRFCPLTRVRFYTARKLRNTYTACVCGKKNKKQPNAKKQRKSVVSVCISLLDTRCEIKYIIVSRVYVPTHTDGSCPSSEEPVLSIRIGRYTRILRDSSGPFESRRKVCLVKAIDWFRIVGRITCPRVIQGVPRRIRPSWQIISR